MYANKTALYLWCKSDYARMKELAEFLKISETFVSFIVHGKKQIPVKSISAISEYTGIPARELRPDLWEIFKDE